MTSYCTYAEVLAMTGTAYPQVTVEAIIVFADRDLNAMLKAKGYAADYADDDLKEAGLNLAMSRVLTRMRMDGTKPASLSMGGLSMSDNIDTAIKELEARAWQLVEEHIAYSAPSRRYYVARSDR